MIPVVYIIGSDKGGVGKTTFTRIMLDYFKKKCRAFDTESEVAGGVLKRFYPDITEIVDLSSTTGQMRVFDTLRTEPLTVIDIRAGLLTPTLVTLKNTGFLDRVKDGSLKVAVAHVLDGTVVSMDEIKKTSGIIEGSKYFLVKNHINAKSFFDWRPDMVAAMNTSGTVIDVPTLNVLASEHVDVTNMGFDDFTRDEKESETLRGYVRYWRKTVFEKLDASGIGGV